MVERSEWSKCLLVAGCCLAATAIVCLTVGGTNYAQHRTKQTSYKKDSCRVRDSSFKTLRNCAMGSKHVGKRCYLPVWEVEYGENRTARATIRGSPENTYRDVIIKQNQYKIDSSYPCWYDVTKPTVAIWYNPTAIYGLILLITGVACVIVSVPVFVVARVLRVQVDL